MALPVIGVQGNVPYGNVVVCLSVASRPVISRSLPRRLGGESAFQSDVLALPRVFDDVFAMRQAKEGCNREAKLKIKAKLGRNGVLKKFL